MSVWLEQKYISLMSSSLQRFTVVSHSPFSAKFRCPICGDSQKNKFKTRGYLFENKGSLTFKCHNCGVAMSAGNLIKHIDPRLHTEYKLELLKERGSPYSSRDSVFVPENVEKTGKNIENFLPFKVLKKISQLKDTHPAKKYLLDRKIPESKLELLYYCPKYCEWVNYILPDKFSEKSLLLDEPRIVIPFVDKNNIVFGCQGRAFNPDSKIRYISVMFDSSRPKIFGLNTINEREKIRVFEGPFDSMFISNSAAMAGADVDLSVLSGREFVVVYDNEPRNKDIVNRIKRDIEKGYSVCIWPKNIEEKDVNEMVLANYSPKYLEKIIDTHTFSGPSALATLNEWKRT